MILNLSLKMFTLLQFGLMNINESSLAIKYLLWNKKADKIERPICFAEGNWNKLHRKLIPSKIFSLENILKIRLTKLNVCSVINAEAPAAFVFITKSEK